jgi:hypothetical protein
VMVVVDRFWWFVVYLGFYFVISYGF